MPELDHTKRRLTWTVHASPLMTLTTDLGLSVRVSLFEHVEGDWDFFFWLFVGIVHFVGDIVASS